MDLHGEGTAPQSAPAPIAKSLVAVVLALVAFVWFLAWWTTDAYEEFLIRQVEGSSPTDTLLFLLLSGVMMVAMMLPSSLPMIGVYRGLARADDAASANGRAWLFSATYFLVWTIFTSASLVVLMALGLMEELGGPLILVPGALILAAGIYQFTGWKKLCLRHCRTPVGFVTTHWRPGRGGAARMGFAHAFYCVGCCWLLMLVLFVAGAMSVLWMGVVALLILGEKVWSQGGRFSQLVGLAGTVAGGLALLLRASELGVGV